MQQQFVGLDVSNSETAVCVVDGAGTVTWQGRCASTPEAIAATVRKRAPEAERIGLETGPLSAWHWRALNAMGLPVVCIDARHAKAALAMQVNKTDANDAFGLAQIVRTGWYREVRVKSEASYRTRSLLAARAKLVEMRREVSHQLRGRPCCIDQWERRTHPYPVLRSCDADVLRASQLQHAVEGVDGYLYFGRPTLIRARAQPVADHPFEPAHGGLDPGASVVA